MTRISSLLLASTLAILPLSAFAQQAAAPVRGPVPATAAAPDTTSMERANGDKIVTDRTGDAVKTTANTAPATANVTQPAKPDVKTTVHGAKPEVHGIATDNIHRARTNVSTKPVEPAKS